MVGRILWTMAYWLGAGISLILVFPFVFSSSAYDPKNISETAAVIVGSIGAVLSAVLATKTALLPLTFADFMRSTNTARLVTGAWLLVGVLILSAVFYDFGVNLSDPNTVTGGQLFAKVFDGSDFVFSLIGFSTVPAVLSFGLSEFHLARQRVKQGTASFTKEALEPEI